MGNFWLAHYAAVLGAAGAGAGVAGAATGADDSPAGFALVASLAGAAASAVAPSFLAPSPAFASLPSLAPALPLRKSVTYQPLPFS